MRRCWVLPAVLLAFAVNPLSVHAGKNPVHEQQAAMARQQQQMIQQEKKMMEQQQKQYQQMLRQQQQMIQQQQKAYEHEQQQQLKAQQARTNLSATNTSASTSTKTNASTVKAKATTTPTTKATSETNATATTVKTHAIATGVSSHGLLRWPHSSTVAYRHLMQLKHSLDAISHQSTPSTRQVASLRTALLNVVQNSPRPPSTHVQLFSNHLATALASRGSAQVDTKDLALSLRAAMNSIHLSANEGEQVLASTQQVLNTAGVSASHVSTVTGDIQFMANEVQASLR